MYWYVCVRFITRKTATPNTQKYGCMTLGKRSRAFRVVLQQPRSKQGQRRSASTDQRNPRRAVYDTVTAVSIIIGERRSTNTCCGQCARRCSACSRCRQWLRDVWSQHADDDNRDEVRTLQHEKPRAVPKGCESHARNIHQNRRRSQPRGILNWTFLFWPNAYLWHLLIPNKLLSIFARTCLRLAV